MSLTEAEAARHARHLQLPGLGPQGMELLRSARIHVVGAGAVAGPAILFLAQAGVGTLYLDDGADVAAADAGAWLYGPDQIGQQRLFAAADAIRAASALVRIRAHASDTLVTATLVCPDMEPVARKAAEQARRSGVPHVVALVNGDGGEVVIVPPGAPCFRCASRPAPRMTSQLGAAAAVGTLAALELLLLVGRVVAGGNVGRRIDLAAGWPTSQQTTRTSGCDCVNVY